MKNEFGKWRLNLKRAKNALKAKQTEFLPRIIVGQRRRVECWLHDGKISHCYMRQTFAREAEQK